MLGKNNFKTNSCNIETFYKYYTEGRVNLNLDVQRSYVWSDEDQQNLWDTLLSEFRIPEIHAIINGNTYEIIDGKQRLTTIFGILSDDIELKKTDILNPEFYYLFAKNKHPIKFSELPQKERDKINFTSLSIAEYTNLKTDSEDYATLFRKINSGKPLSEIAQGISKNIHLRTHFTNIILTHKIFNPSSFCLVNGQTNIEQTELALIRYIGLLKYGTTRSLDTTEIPYEEFSVRELVDYCARLNALLDKIGTLEKFNNNRSKKTGLPLLLWDIDRFNLNGEDIQKYIQIFNDNYTSSLTSNRNFNAQRIIFFKEKSEEWVKELYNTR